MPLWAALPFLGLLLAIAVLPLAAAHFWEKNANKAKIAALFALPIAAYLLLAHGAAGRSELGHKLGEYASFLVLLGALYTITGGIHVRGSLSGTPLVNTAILGLGAVLASLIGTTGASVLLIRPLLRANRAREARAHVFVFFIFIVSNCGGLLTPLGDPPLFLGFLKGVPFAWTLGLWRVWLLANGALLGLFSVWDQMVLNREELRRPGAQLEEVQRHEPLGIDGGQNFVFLLGVIAVIAASGAGVWNGGEPWPFGPQELGMALLAALAYATSARANRERNGFTFGPIVEVAVLFAGIFVCMAPALQILNSWGRSEREVLGLAFGVSEPWQYFWATGGLSSFLDNAPTYLTFSATAAGAEGIALEGRFLGEFIARGDSAQAILRAISAGAVLMGANTYIGNGPNFMVKAIAEESGVRMPSFFGYMGYALVILIPLFILVTLVVFR